MQTKHYLPRSLPEPIRGLAELALDLRWSWNHGADSLWQQVAPKLWEATSNPWLILETVSDKRLQTLAKDPEFLQKLQEQLAAREHHLSAKTWFAETIDGKFQGNVAYFSMEFGICESLPIYSGGLGVLAGDYLKTACDLDVPIIGVGLLYQQGYFHQVLSLEGEQMEFYPYNDPTMLPVIPLRDDQGEWVRITVELPGRALHLRTWHAQVGRRSLLLLDSNDPLNNPGDRAITSELYGGNVEMRLQQEIVLGIGGWRLLETLDLDCPVCHLNEGHAAFAILERARCYMRENVVDFNTALWATRAGNLFTTHTPVAAGFDLFSPQLFTQYFNHYAESLQISIDDLLALGRQKSRDAQEAFNMAYLAIRGSGAINGVSQLHGKVSQQIFSPLFPRWPLHEIPVGAVTNGVHVPSWDSPDSDNLWTDACGKSRWLGTLEELRENIQQIPDETLWNFRAASRRRMLDYIRKQQVKQQKPLNPARDYSEVLEADTLTLGFARRFAQYKRPNLLLHDPNRLVRILNNPNRPVQLVIAGKAHPQDKPGKAMLRQWQDFIRQYDLWQKVIFVEDYDLGVAEQLTQGVDVWVNTPRRPWEASGTSGMKVLVNGGLNLSELDGWWAEAYDENVGWAIGDGQEHENIAYWDAIEARQLYETLEQEVIPCFYQRDTTGIPRDWVKRMRESMARLTTQYSTNRMLREYAEKYYLPLAANWQNRSQQPNMAPNLEQWHQHLSRHWDHIHFGNINWQQMNDCWEVELQVYLDEIDAKAVKVEIYANPLADGEPFRQVIERNAPLTGALNAWIYRGKVPASRPLTDYTPRVVPWHPQAKVPLEANMIKWFR